MSSSGTLILTEMRRLFRKASTIADSQDKCDICGRKANFYYFVEDFPVGATCRKHQIKEKDARR